MSTGIAFASRTFSAALAGPAVHHPMATHR
jgi:hypothetical protein